MGEEVDIFINGNKYKAIIIKNLEIEGRYFCLYAVPTGDGNFGIKYGKIIGDQVVDVEDETEKIVVENIVKTLLLSKKKEELLHMNDEDSTFIVIDENGEEKQAHLMDDFDFEGKTYIAYAVEEDDNYSGIYIKERIYDENGEESVKSIENAEEKERVFAAFRDYINKEVGDL